MRLEFIGSLIVFLAALFASLQRNYPDLFGRINPGLAGLSIAYALQVNSTNINNYILDTEYYYSSLKVCTILDLYNYFLDQ